MAVEPTAARSGLAGVLLGAGIAAILAAGWIFLLLDRDGPSALSPPSAPRRNSVRAAPGAGGTHPSLPATAVRRMETTARAEDDAAEAAGDPENPGKQAPPALGAMHHEHEAEARRSHGTPAAPTDPGLQALEELEVDLSSPDAEMRRLFAEYRTLLLAQGTGGIADAARMALLDRGMAALIRNHPETAGTVYELLASEGLPAATRYLAYLMRDGERGSVEGALIRMAASDFDPARRASALTALGPAPAGPALDAIVAGLEDSGAEVRGAAAEGILESAQVHGAQPELRAALRRALSTAQDAGRRRRLLAAYLSPTGRASPEDQSFLAELSSIEGNASFESARNHTRSGR